MNRTELFVFRVEPDCLHFKLNQTVSKPNCYYWYHWNKYKNQIKSYFIIFKTELFQTEPNCSELNCSKPNWTELKCFNSVQELLLMVRIFGSIRFDSTIWFSFLVFCPTLIMVEHFKYRQMKSLLFELCPLHNIILVIMNWVVVGRSPIMIMNLYVKKLWGWTLNIFFLGKDEP